MENDQRKSYRHAIRVPIQLMETDTATGDVLCEDLSQGGLSFYWPDAIPGGTHLELSVPVEKQFFKLSAEVRYSQKDEHTGLFKTGVCFSDATHAFHTKLSEEAVQIRQYREKMALLRGKWPSEKEASELWIARQTGTQFKAAG
jgi:c-di-GMP-binding flagellar brake protein YcgR